MTAVKPFIPPVHTSPTKKVTVVERRFDWENQFAQDLIDHEQEIVTIDASESVEQACELLLSSNLSCLIVTQPALTLTSTSPVDQAVGLFDWADANSFLTLILSSTSSSSSSSHHNPFSCPVGEQGPNHDLEERVKKLQAMIRKGTEVVPVGMACDLSGKNPLVTLSSEAPLLSLLSIFSTGTHRILLLPPTPSSTQPFAGLLSDRHLLRHIHNSTSQHLGSSSILSHTLAQLKLGSHDVVKMADSRTVLDAMRVMSEEGVSSLAVVDEMTGGLVGAVSVVDIGKFVIPSQTRSILATTLSQFIRQTSAKIGADDGEDHVPVYSVPPLSTLSYTISKILATKSHRTYLSYGSSGAPSPSSPGLQTFLLPSSPSRSNFLSSSPSTSASFGGRAAGETLGGVVSIVDVLGVFAKEAGLVSAPTGLRDRRRRASSTTSSYSGSSKSGGFDIRS
ncbi:hypothetical protein BDY24DRAFT_392381 [Mrakia frigida]|uniref:uncharacterized protein n=1 Tax=Mrakia frigida TaxID=29902 RepID=UPI003FCBFDF1